jgi:hypothetical protein
MYSTRNAAYDLANWPARRWSVGSSDRVATQSILPECHRTFETIGLAVA